MADINQVITLGIGTPADIEHFILVGLNVSAAAVNTHFVVGTVVLQRTVAGDTTLVRTLAGDTAVTRTLAGDTVFGDEDV